MGIERQSLYNCFGDKRALYHSCLQSYECRVLVPELGIFELAVSPLTVLYRFFQRKLDFILDDTHPPGCFLINCQVEQFSKDLYSAVFVKRYLSRLEECFASALTRAVKEHEIPADKDTRSLARQLLIEVQGLLLVGRVMRDRDLLQRSVQQALGAINA